MKAIKYGLLITGLFFLSACTSPPEGITPVKNFDIQKYKGKWFEIARLNHSFEEGMEQVTATYSINDDGTVKVLNKGYLTDDKKWDDAEGLAKFVEGTDTGHFKVSFFGPHFFELELFFRVGGVVGLVNKLEFEVDCVKSQFYMLQCHIFLVFLE